MISIEKIYLLKELKKLSDIKFSEKLNEILCKCKKKDIKNRLKSLKDKSDLKIEELIYEAIVDGNIERLLKLLEDNESYIGYEYNEYKGLGLLHIATMSNKVEIVKLLLSKFKFDPNKTDKLERTSLHIACSSGYRDIVIILLGYGADSNLKG
jgi:ankyrin repeat protein